jgi:hypothetical protein
MYCRKKRDSRRQRKMIKGTRPPIYSYPSLCYRNFRRNKKFPSYLRGLRGRRPFGATCWYGSDSNYCNIPDIRLEEDHEEGKIGHSTCPHCLITQNGCSSLSFLVGALPPFLTTGSSASFLCISSPSQLGHMMTSPSVGDLVKSGRAG